MLMNCEQANISPTAIPSSGPSSTSSSSYARATAAGVDGRLGFLGLGVVAAGVLLG